MLSEDEQKKVKELVGNWIDCKFLEKFKAIGKVYEKKLDALKSVQRRK